MSFRSTPGLRAATLFVLSLPALSCIPGGIPVVPEDWPGIVQVLDGTTFVCSGVLIAPDVVVTASHCYDTGARVTPDRIRVSWSDGAGGLLNRDYAIVASCRELPTDPICAAIRPPVADLELYRLEAEVPPEELAVARLGLDDQLAGRGPRWSFRELWAVGWGGRDTALRAARVRSTMSPSTCIRDYFPPSPDPRDGPFGNADNIICAEGNITESGDSGGPLYARIGDDVVLVGITQGSLTVFFPGRPPTVSLWHRVPAFLSEIPGVVEPSSGAGWSPACMPVGDDPNPVSVTVGDFTGEGLDDVLYDTFALDSGGAWRMLLRTGTSTAIADTEGELAITPLAGNTVVAGHFSGAGGPAQIAGVSGDHVRVLTPFYTPGEPVFWDPADFPDYDLRAIDPYWDNNGDYFLDPTIPRHAPLLRPGDLNGDGLTDLVLMTYYEVRVLENDGGADWITRAPTADENPAAEGRLAELHDEAWHNLTLADVVPEPAGTPVRHELVARLSCGLVVWRYVAGLWTELYAQSCTAPPPADVSLSDDAGFGRWGRDRFVTGDFDGDGCADVAARGSDRMRILLSDCGGGPGGGVSFTSLETGSVDPLVYWREPFGRSDASRAAFDGWGRAPDHRLLAGDLDGDGLDDLVGMGPYGIEARLNRTAAGTTGVFEAVLHEGRSWFWPYDPAEYRRLAGSLVWTLHLVNRSGSGVDLLALDPPEWPPPDPDACWNLSSVE